MKAITGLVIFTVLASSCMNYSCPTYGNTKGRSANVEAKKSKAGRGKTPYYKTMKVAERD